MHRNPTALHVLPSYMKRKVAAGDHSKVKRPKSVKTWDRDVLCLPMSRKNGPSGSSIKYPRGKYCSWLATSGLLGKLHFTTEMSELNVMNEIRSIFNGPMGGNPDFRFLYLQPTGGGARSLTIPFLSSSFKWVPQQVAKLAGQTGVIYILAQDELTLSDIVSDVSVVYLFIHVYSYIIVS